MTPTELTLVIMGAASIVLLVVGVVLLWRLGGRR